MSEYRQITLEKVDVDYLVQVAEKLDDLAVTLHSVAADMRSTYYSTEPSNEMALRGEWCRNTAEILRQLVEEGE